MKRSMTRVAGSEFGTFGRREKAIFVEVISLKFCARILKYHRHKDTMFISVARATF